VPGLDVEGADGQSLGEEIAHQVTADEAPAPGDDDVDLLAHGQLLCGSADLMADKLCRLVMI
jgi:hypothetical protein